jgi:hypothetical protein
MNIDIANLSLDMERISIGEHFFDTIKCGLCYFISGSPLIMKCCENIICSICINSWKEKNKNNCPICRKEDYSYNPPNRFEKNIFLSIKFFCNYKDNGCEEKNLTIENMIQHEKKCIKNPHRLINCEKCLQDYPANLNYEHDCTNFLLEKIKTLNEELNLYKSTLKKHPYILSSLK